MPVNVVGNLIYFFGYIYSSKILIWLYVLTSKVFINFDPGTSFRNLCEMIKIFDNDFFAKKFITLCNN